MLHNDRIHLQLWQERRRDLLQQAEQERLARQVIVKPHRHVRWAYRMRDWLGRQLVVAGQRLQSDHRAAITITALRATHRGR